MKVIIIIVAVLSLVFGAAWVLASHREGLGHDDVFASEQHDVIPLHQNFYMAERFLSATQEKYAYQESVSQAHVVLVPHHLLASSMIANVLSGIDDREIESIVLIGPNHDNDISSTFATTAAYWETPFGMVESDSSQVQNLRQVFHSSDARDAFLDEHSLGALMPFVKYYFPKAQVVPVILGSDADMREIEKLSSWLTSHMNRKTLVIFSVDFSHYLNEEEANRNDQETKGLMQTQNIGRILQLGNTHVDSPAAVATFIEYARRLGQEITFLDHANANNFLSEPEISTTGYFTAIVRP